MRKTSVKNFPSPIKPMPSLFCKSPNPTRLRNQPPPAFTTAKKREAKSPALYRVSRPKSVNQSYDLSLNSSKMFTIACEPKTKFDPEAVPSPVFDIHACKEEINRLNSQVTVGILLENQLMRSD